MCMYTHTCISELLIEYYIIVQFYASVAEAESWMNDKKPLVSSEDYGKDEDTAETLIKKHEVIEKDIIGMRVCVVLFVCTKSSNHYTNEYIILVLTIRVVTSNFYM